jgi:anti-sigma factor RsiW
MSCDFTDNISLLIDGALSSGEAGRARSHIAACPECRNAMDQFVALREALKAYAGPADDVSQRRALNTILSSSPTSVWERRLSVPAPVMASLLVSLIALGAWSFLTHIGATRVAEPAHPAAVAPPSGDDGTGAHPSPEIGLELSRLDHGGRAVIIKVRRGQSTEAAHPGRISQ